MKYLSNDQISAVSAELDIIRSNSLQNFLVAKIEGREEDAKFRLDHAIAMHWAIQKLMEDWATEVAESVNPDKLVWVNPPYVGAPTITYKEGMAFSGGSHT